MLLFLLYNMNSDMYQTCFLHPLLGMHYIVLEVMFPDQDLVGSYTNILQCYD